MMSQSTETIHSRIRLTNLVRSGAMYDADQLIKDIGSVLIEDNAEIEWLRQELMQSGLTAAQYEKNAQSTMNKDLASAETAINAALGLVGESGEIAEVIASQMSGDDFSKAVLVLSAHCGAVVEMVKKHRFHGHDLDVVRLYGELWFITQQARQVYALHHTAAHNVSIGEIDIKEELGDAQWYIPQMCYALGLKLEEVMRFNNQKLFERYGDKFSCEASKNRIR